MIMPEFNPFGQLLQSRIASDRFNEDKRKNALQEGYMAKQEGRAQGAYDAQQQDRSSEYGKALGPIASQLSKLTPEQRAESWPQVHGTLSRFMPGAVDGLTPEYNQEIESQIMGLAQWHDSSQEPTDQYEGIDTGYETFLRAHQLTPNPDSYAEYGKQVIAQKKAGATNVTQSVGGGTLTPGEKKIDEKYADQFITWEASGGYADNQKLIGQLEEVSTRLGSGTDTLTGPIIGSTPDSVLKFTNPEALDTRELVEEVVQRNLRAVLGAQFTEKEGERLIKRAYNPNLSETQNKERVDSLTKQMRLAGEAKDSAAQYMRANGTLKGWTGRHPKFADFNKAIDGKITDYGVASKGEEVTTQAQYDNLPSGSVYIEDGQRYRKP